MDEKIGMILLEIVLETVLLDTTGRTGIVLEMRDGEIVVGAPAGMMVTAEMTRVMTVDEAGAAGTVADAWRAAVVVGIMVAIGITITIDGEEPGRHETIRAVTD
jgi:hypothetical protein